MNDIRALIGRNLTRIRQEKGMTLAELEELSGCSQAYLSGLARGARNLTVITLRDIADALDVSIHRLIDGVEELPKSRRQIKPRGMRPWAKAKAKAKDTSPGKT